MERDREIEISGVREEERDGRIRSVHGWGGLGLGCFQLISTFLNSYIFDPIESIKTNQLNPWELVGLGWIL